MKKLIIILIISVLLLISCEHEKVNPLTTIIQDTVFKIKTQMDTVKIISTDTFYKINKILDTVWKNKIKIDTQTVTIVQNDTVFQEIHLPNDTVTMGQSLYIYEYHFPLTIRRNYPGNIDANKYKPTVYNHSVSFRGSLIHGPESTWYDFPVCGWNVNEIKNYNMGDLDGEQVNFWCNNKTKKLYVGHIMRYSNGKFINRESFEP